MAESVTLGHFQLLAEIGRGGMGTVFQAFDPTLNRQVAIKVLSDHLSREPKFVADFLREARNAAAISHPHIVQVHFVGEAGGQYYVVMELLKGRSLESLIEQDRSVAEEPALQIGRDVAAALRAAYQTNQMIHGDIKPANIFVTAETGAKVLDFGLAKLANVEAPAAGDIWGSPYYLSPERIGRKAEDFRSDIYSLGATLFHALTGRPPFDADTVDELALKRLNERAPRAREIKPELTAATDDLLAKMLSKSPLTRYRDYEHLLEQLDEAHRAATAQRLGIEVHASPGPHSPAERPAETTVAAPVKKFPWPLVAGAGSALVAAGIGVAVWLAHRQPPVPPPAPVVAQPVPKPVTPVIVTQQIVTVVTTTSGPPVVVPVAPPVSDDQRRQQEQAQLAALQQRTAAELKLIQAGEVELAGLWPKYNFAAIIAHYQALAGQVTTADAKKLLSPKLGTAKQLADFKMQLMTDIAAQPYARGDLLTSKNVTLSGKLTRATDAELTFTTQYGELTAPWSDLPAATVVQLARYYIPAEAGDAATRRQQLLAAFMKQYNVAPPPPPTKPVPPKSQPPKPLAKPKPASGVKA